MAIDGLDQEAPQVISNGFWKSSSYSELLGLMLFDCPVLRWCLSDKSVLCYSLFHTLYRVEPNCCCWVSKALSAYIPRGLASALFIHNRQRRVEKETRNDKTPWSRFSSTVSLQLVSLHPIGLCCVLDLLQQTILKHARVRSDEFGGRHAVSRHDSVRLNIFRFSFSLSFTSVACVLLCSASSTLFLIHLPLSLRNPFRGIHHHHHHLLSLIRKKKILFI